MKDSKQSNFFLNDDCQLAKGARDGQTITKWNYKCLFFNFYEWILLQKKNKSNLRKGTNYRLMLKTRNYTSLKDLLHQLISFFWSTFSFFAVKLLIMRSADVSSGWNQEAVCWLLRMLQIHFTMPLVSYRDLSVSTSRFVYSSWKWLHFEWAGLLMDCRLMLSDWIK